MRIRTIGFTIVIFLGFQLRIEAQQVFWTDYRPGQYGKITRANLDGTVVVDVFNEPNSIPRGLAIDAARFRMYFIIEDINANVTLRSAFLDGSDAQVIVNGAPDGRGVALDLVNRKVYWVETNFSRIRRANLDGSSVETLPVDASGGPNDIEVDPLAGKFYWTTSSTARVQRANLDGTSQELLISGMGETSGIALDLQNGKMYWSDSGATRLRKANLDGSNVVVLFTLNPGGSGMPGDLSIDLAGGKIYWTSITPDNPFPRIARANLDDTSVQTLLTGTGLRPQGIALAIPYRPIPAISGMGIAAMALFLTVAGVKVLRRSKLPHIESESC